MINKTKKSRTVTNIILTILILALLFTVILVLIELGVMSNPFLNQNIRPIQKNFNIQDPCSIIAGKIIHPIDREEDCQTKCIASCEVIKLSFDKMFFERKNTSCNTCNCNCK